METSSNKKTIIIIASAAVAVLAIVGIIVGIVIANQPKYVVARAITNTYNDFKKSDLYTTYDNVSAHGSTAVSWNPGDDYVVMAKAYTNKSNISSVVETSLYDDDKLLADANFYFNNNSFVLGSTALGDGEYYGISFRNAKKNLPGSVFDPDEDTTFSFSDDDAFEAFMNIYSTLHKMNGIDKDLDKLAETYRNQFIAAIDNNSETTTGHGVVKTDEGRINCKTVNFEIDEEAFTESLTEICEYAMDDPKLREVVESYANIYAISLQEDPEDLVDEFYDEIEDLMDELEDADDVDTKVNLTFYIKNSRVIATKIEDKEDDVEIYLILGKNMKNPSNITLTVEQEDNKAKFEYKVSEDSSKNYSAEFTFDITTTHTRYSYYDSYDWDYEQTEPTTYTDRDKGKITIDWDKKKGDYTIEYEDNDDSNFIIEGTYIEKGNLHTIEIESLYIDNGYDRNNINLNLTIILNEKDRMPSSPKFIEITKLDEDDLEDVIDDIGDDFEDVLEDVFEDIEDNLNDIDYIL